MDTHFTQNENNEKLISSKLIGKFGVGLKDALAVFYRKGINVEINSKYAHITLELANKTGFEIKTLHANFDATIDSNMMGTDFIITGISDEIIKEAKSMFLCFSELELLETTKYGGIYQENESPPSIYINGVKVATEENFLFSYNITNINTQVKKALNRERSNVGRTAYADTVKNILKQCTSEKVLYKLVNDLQNVMRGTNKDESNWIDVATHAAKTLNRNGDVVFMTPLQRSTLTNNQVEILNQSGKKLIMITESVYDKIETSVNTYENIYCEYENLFTYKFVKYDQLALNEKFIYDTSKSIIEFLELHKYRCNIPIKISETIMMGQLGFETNSVFDIEQKSIIIKRSVLNSRTDFLEY